MSCAESAAKARENAEHNRRVASEWRGKGRLAKAAKIESWADAWQACAAELEREAATSVEGGGEGIPPPAPQKWFSGLPEAALAAGAGVGLGLFLARKLL